MSKKKKQVNNGIQDVFVVLPTIDRRCAFVTDEQHQYRLLNLPQPIEKHPEDAPAVSDEAVCAELLQTYFDNKHFQLTKTTDYVGEMQLGDIVLHIYTAPLPALDNDKLQQRHLTLLTIKEIKQKLLAEQIKDPVTIAALFKVKLSILG